MSLIVCADAPPIDFHEPVLRLICEAVDINMPDPAGWSPLMTAVHTGDTKVLAVLLECKVCMVGQRRRRSPNGVLTYGCVAMMLAG